MALVAATMPPVRRSGTLLCLTSATAFGAMAAFGKLAYDAGATVGTLLSVRFGLAAVLLWALVAVRARGASPVRGLSRRDVATALALGACGYAIRAGCFFVALERIDASLLSLVLYTPAIVAVAAIALGRERANARRLAALVLACGGLTLTVAGAGAGSFDALGVGLAFGAAVTYATYILISEGVAGRMAPHVLTALVCTGAAASLTVGSALSGQLRPGELTAAGWGWLVCIAVICTVAAVSLFFAGLERVRATTASILATLEPLVTVLLAFLVFGEMLSAVQLLGGAVMLGAVVVLTASPPSKPRVRPA